MPLTLSLNTNPLVNRFADLDDLVDTVCSRLAYPEPSAHA